MGHPVLEELFIGRLIFPAIFQANSQGRSQRRAGAECPSPRMDGKKFGQISHKNRENQEKWGDKNENWEENGKLAGSLPLRTGRAGYGPANSVLCSEDMSELLIFCIPVINYTSYSPISSKTQYPSGQSYKKVEKWAFF